jgi:putative selenate reductase
VDRRELVDLKNAARLFQIQNGVWSGGRLEVAMSEIMRPIPFPALIDWVLGEFKTHGSVFGISKEKIFYPQSGRMKHFDTENSSPLGPAAGPHSQLAQNILAAYLAGGRFMELKTVQIMDGEELRKAVARPCISALDEGYNVEWSTELTVGEAFEEYVKAWFLCHVFAVEFGIAQGRDFMFNMSAGYSLDGIKSEKIDSFIEGMKDARNTPAWKRCYEYLSGSRSRFSRFTSKDLDAVSPCISSGLTLSTLHGCPRDEIERIAAYLLGEKGLHTYVKCNPTLLGYEAARGILDSMGYGAISFDDHHFKNDLQFNDAVDMLGRLLQFAKEKKRSFGVKLTNTFPVEIKRNELPGSEMYMSGRSLFPLSINVAKKISQAFEGRLPISYSGGADFFNLEDILKTGIRPVTAATTILKPGGYERLAQLAKIGAGVLEKESGRERPIDVKALEALVSGLNNMGRYRREYRQGGPRKTSSPLPLFDCPKAPCMDGGCPLHQNIPAYLAETAGGNFRAAFEIIAKDNTAPGITGTICDHQCQHKCTRVDYEDPLNIRRAKLFAADNAEEAYTLALAAPKKKTGKSAAVIGAGPAGLAAAIFLRRNGVPVKVYEKRERPYGAVQYLIPAFRISDETIYRDYAMAEKMGVEFAYNAPESWSIGELKKNHSFVIIAAGAWKEGAPAVKQGQEGIIDALRFLEDSKKSKLSLELGKRVAVIGGGDVAMDCARAAKRNRGVESVSVVYRRTREFMPAQYEEQEAALGEGVELLELLAPESWLEGRLICELMRLGDYDESGRRGIEGTGEKRSLPFDTVISAVGARVETRAFTANGIALNARGFPQVNAFCESSLEDVYVAGDCMAGASTVVKAIAGGKAAAFDILRKLGLPADFSCGDAGAAQGDCAALGLKKGLIAPAQAEHTDGLRCLSCNALCEICVDVCPNRANVMAEFDEGPLFAISRQVIHIDRMCNECGNCAGFCPHAGKPYKDKFTVFANREDFTESGNRGFLKTGPETCLVRLEDSSTAEYKRGGDNIPKTWIAAIETIESKYGYLL